MVTTNRDDVAVLVLHVEPDLWGYVQQADDGHAGRDDVGHQTRYSSVFAGDDYNFINRRMV